MANVVYQLHRQRTRYNYDVRTGDLVAHTGTHTEFPLVRTLMPPDHIKQPFAGDH
jgi:hypothetical protein